MAILTLLLLLAATDSLWASGANVMNYGADGNDYYQFTVPSMAFDKVSGFTTLIPFAMHVNTDGSLVIGGDVVCSNGVYLGPTNWGSLVAELKTPPTTVTRYEVAIGGWEDGSYNDIESLVSAHGTGPGSILYKNFKALKEAVPGIDAINDDDEETYDLNSSASFANMLGSLGYKFTMVPYTAQSFWVDLYNKITNCDYVYVQCYEGGAGNDPGQWNTAFGHEVPIIPGQESNTSDPATFRSWYLETGIHGGFYYPDVVFDSTYWSAAVIESYGLAPTPPTVEAAGGVQGINLAWNVVPGAISYNLMRSSSRGAETNFLTISTTNNNWPASNEYLDGGLPGGTTHYYKISAVNTNGASIDSAEVAATTISGTISANEVHGSANTYPFKPSWIIITNGDLILRQTPSAAVGNFGEEASGATANSLTSGGSLTISQTSGTQGLTCSSNYVTCGNGTGPDGSIAGSLVTYTLGGSATGYNVSNITVYGGWQDNGRDEQAYTIYYATASAPTNFIFLTSVGYTPSGVPASTPSSTRVIIAGQGGALATNVAAVMFDFTSPPSENGWCGYAQIALCGAPSSPPTLSVPNMSAGSLVLQGTGGEPEASYTLLSSTNLGLPLSEWTTNSTGSFSASGGFSNAIPFNAVGQFFRLRVP